MPEEGKYSIDIDEPEEEPEELVMPEDPEEQAEFINALGRQVLAEHAMLAKQYMGELKRRKLKGESLRAVAYAASTSTDKIRDTRKALQELAPTRIIAEFNFGLPDADNKCPCCKQPWPEDVPREMSGFDKVEA